MKENRIQELYLYAAPWYDSVKKAWNRLLTARAEEELKIFLQNNLSPATAILELGCGTAANLETIHALRLPFKTYTGLDFSPHMLAVARKKFNGYPHVVFQEKDITTLTDIRGRFDIIICTWVLSHLKQPSDLVNAAQRLLKKKGKLFLIFFTKPRWYINIWMYLLAKYFFRATYVPEEEIARFTQVTRRYTLSSGIATIIEVSKEQTGRPALRRKGWMVNK